jgi:hypothetical protein
VEGRSVGRQPHVFKDSGDSVLRCHGRDDLHSPRAPTAFENVRQEHSPNQRRPRESAWRTPAAPGNGWTSVVQVADTSFVSDRCAQPLRDQGDVVGTLVRNIRTRRDLGERADRQSHHPAGRRGRLASRHPARRDPPKKSAPH